MQLEWGDLSVILAVCRAGTLSGAARHLGVDHSTVYRRVNTIEERTGVRFFVRLSDGYRMTEAGETTLQYAERIENEVHALGREIVGQDARLQGSVRVTAPEGMMAQLLPQAAAQFLMQHPGVKIDLIGGTDSLDLSKREAEVAVRATRKPPDSSLAQKVCSFRFGLYSSRKYLKTWGDEPLSEASWCFIRGISAWLVPLIWKKQEHADACTVLSGNSVHPLIEAVAQGVGVTALPCYIGDREKRLVRIGPPLESLSLQLWVLTHTDLRHTVRVKTLMSHLQEFLSARADLFEGKTGAEVAALPLRG